MSHIFRESAAVAKLRDWFKINKPDALQWGEWKDWEKITRHEHPVGYWFTETLPYFLDGVEDMVFGPFRDARYYFRNRFHRKCHILPTGLKPGDYFDLDTRILHGVMEALVDYVEVEKAWMQHIWNDEGKKVTLVRGRNAEAGLDYLRWEMTLDNPERSEEERCSSQAAVAREIVIIYNWWKVERPLRPDPYDASGYTKAFEGFADVDILDERADYDKEKFRTLSNIVSEIEKRYDDEDTAMLIRVMVIRKSLWT
jgi:hypothetical protein